MDGGTLTVDTTSALDRFAQAVLATDQSTDLYLSGRQKQTLRTNLGRGHNAGITCRDVREVDELSALRNEVPSPDDVADWYIDWDGLSQASFVARHADGELLAIASATVDGRWGVAGAVLDGLRTP